MLMSRLTLGALTLFATLLATACMPSTTEAPEPAAASPEVTQAEPPATPDPEPTTDLPEGPTTRTGTFASAEHATSGRVELTSQNGQQILVFDQSFATADGPDLVVVLHRSANVIAASTPPAYPLNEEDYVVIAPLAATTGAQEYVVPAEIDLTAFQSVAVWCQAFNATFGAAPLQ